MKATSKVPKDETEVPAPDTVMINHYAWVYADTRRMVAHSVSILEAEMADAKRRHLPDIRKLVGVQASAEADLHAAVAARPDLFTRPKTRILHGIKFGWTKQKGKISWDDPAKVVKAIRRLFPRRFKSLVKTTEAPIKTALNALSAADLKKLGVTVGSDTDTVTIAPIDSEIDKLVKTLLASARDAAGDGES